MINKSLDLLGLLIDLARKDIEIVALALHTKNVGFALAITDRLVLDTKILQDTLHEYIDSPQQKE